jgi:hypothetical protein
MLSHSRSVVRLEGLGQLKNPMTKLQSKKAKFILDVTSVKTKVSVKLFHMDKTLQLLYCLKTMKLVLGKGHRNVKQNTNWHVVSKNVNVLIFTFYFY